MRVLVTGGAGYIGSVMVRMLVHEGHEILVLDNLSKGHGAAAGDAPLEVVDLIDLASVRGACRQFRPDACMHFAAHNLVGDSMENPLFYLHSNVTGGLNLMKGLVEAGCRLFVLSSTAAVYGDPETNPIPESASMRPVSTYGLTKVMLEQALRELDRVGDLRYVSLRYFNAAGADVENDLGEDHRPETHLIPKVIKAALAGGRAEIFGTDYPTRDGTCVRDYVHVIDLCRAHLLALDRLAGGAASTVYNLGNGSGSTVREVIDTVREISGLEFEVVEGARRQGDPPELVASSEKISRELGWEPGFPYIDEIVRTAWEWHSAHPEGYPD